MSRSRKPPSEFAPGVDQPPSHLGRRELFKLLGASAALAGLGGCQPRRARHILPRHHQPEELVPGVPVEYSTSMVLDGFALGLVATTYEARPTKLEGNPEHPASLGATGVFEQASVLELYDPERASSVLMDGRLRSRRRAMAEIAARAPLPGLWFLMLPQSGPLVAELASAILRRHPGARFVFDSPLGRREVYRGAELAFGRPLEAQYDLRRAQVVVSLDADFLASGPMSVRWARDFGQRRRLSSPDDDPSRLYVAEPMPTPTGSMADHRARARAGAIGALAAALLAELARAGRQPQGAPVGLWQRMAAEPLPQEHAGWVRAAAGDLVASAGAGLVLAGERQPAEVHALAHLANAALGNLGQTVGFTEPAIIDPLGTTIDELAEAARAGEVQTLVVLEANPAYTAPADLEFARLLGAIPQIIHLSRYRDETGRLATWSLPARHYLESWGDARAYDGTVSFVQPLIEPLRGGMSVPEVLAAFAGDENPRDRDILRASHRRTLAAIAGGDRDFEQVWQGFLRRGFVAGSAFEQQAPPVQFGSELEQAVSAAVEAGAEGAQDGGRYELCFAASPAVYDGRFANNSWLQELPKPMTKLTWDNAAMMSLATARRHDLESGRLVRLEVGGRSAVAPVLVVPGHADGAVTLELGYGREAGGSVAADVGVDAYRLRDRATPHRAGGLTLERVPGRRRLAVTQGSFRQEGREIALAATLEAYRRDPDFTAPHRDPLPTLLSPRLAGGPQWAMTIDTTICTGCSACVVACQAENNVPTVGREGVLRYREMHWLRIDTYLSGDEADPDSVHQPMLCQHCDMAPCEYVCPVYATLQSPDGLNEMIYNRCVGTRFCSNNCPYKVRRFNWFDYTGDTPRTTQLQRNPNVTVRARGVMEKCTFCVQRIRSADISARLEGRALEAGDVVTACQQACPTGAIQFGALHQEETAMVRWRREPRRYAVLHHEGTRPRTLYLARIRNPNPERG